VRDLHPATIYPGHGARIDDAAAVIEEYISHRVAREAQVLDAARHLGDAFVPMDLVPVLYAGYPVEVYPLAAWTVQAHLDKLVAERRVDRLGHDSDDGGPRYVARRE
jgi:endoribonuclease LACTB2